MSSASFQPPDVPGLGHTPRSCPARPSFISGNRVAPSLQWHCGQLHQWLGQLHPGFHAEAGGQVSSGTGGLWGSHQGALPTRHSIPYRGGSVSILASQELRGL